MRSGYVLPLSYVLCFHWLIFSCVTQLCFLVVYVDRSVYDAKVPQERVENAFESTSS